MKMVRGGEHTDIEGTEERPTPDLDRGPGCQLLRADHELLRCPISDEEHRTKGVLLSSLLAARAELEARHKEERAVQKQEMLDHDLQIAKVREDVASQSETRSVDIEVIADFHRGVVETVRLDTGKVIRSRPMRDDERQLEMS